MTQSTLTYPELPRKPFFSIYEAEYYLGCSRSHLYVLKDRGALVMVKHPHQRGTAITYESLIAYLSRLVPLSRGKPRKRPRKPLPRPPGEEGCPVG